MLAAFCVIQIAIREAGGIDLILLAFKNHVANVRCGMRCPAQYDFRLIQSGITIMIILIFLIIAYVAVVGVHNAGPFDSNGRH